jgi:hypothetical protein
MTTRTAVDDLLAARALAVVGVSRGGRKFGNAVCRELARCGYRVFAIGRSGTPPVTADGADPLYPSLDVLPERVDGLVTVVPPAQTEAVVREAALAGVPRIWMQQGSSSPAAIRFCEEHGIAVVHGECILMFLPGGHVMHRFHHWLWGALGKLPR